jgi:hypothetical protein
MSGSPGRAPGESYRTDTLGLVAVAAAAQAVRRIRDLGGRVGVGVRESGLGGVTPRPLEG